VPRAFPARSGNKSGAQELSGQAPEGNCLMASADEYRRHASECVRLAQETQSPTDKALLLRMAETWLRLAQQAENRGQKTPR
jgi:hypothetical protein